METNKDRLKDKETSTKLPGDLITKAVAGGLIVLVVAGLSFAGGMAYQKNKPVAAGSSQTASNLPSQGPGGQFGGRSGLRGVFGQVTAVSPTSISVQDSRTSSLSTLEITAATQVLSSGQAASVSDIKVGDSVRVRPSPSNAKQAATITLNPQMLGPGGANAPSSTQPPTTGTQTN